MSFVFVGSKTFGRQHFQPWEKNEKCLEDEQLWMSSNSEIQIFCMIFSCSQFNCYSERICTEQTPLQRTKNSTRKLCVTQKPLIVFLPQQCTWAMRCDAKVEIACGLSEKRIVWNEPHKSIIQFINMQMFTRLFT